MHRKNDKIPYEITSSRAQQNGRLLQTIKSFVNEKNAISWGNK